MANMDSVFDSCTKDELEFDVMFNREDDLLIDMIAGYDECGQLLTGPEIDFFSEGEDMVGENPDFDYQKDGDAAYDLKDAEGTKPNTIEVGGEVGDGKEVSGKANSAESHAHDVTKDIEDAITSNNKQTTSLEATKEDEVNGMYNLNESAPDVTDIVDENMKDIDAMLNDFINECDCPDAAARSGCTKDIDTKNVEGVSQEPIGVANAKANTKIDPIEDCDDDKVRDGEKCAVKDVEGEESRAIGAALEAAQKILDDMDTEEILANIADAEKPLIDDSINVNEADETNLDDAEEDDIIEIVDDEGGSSIDLSNGFDDDEIIDAIIKGNI